MKTILLIGGDSFIGSKFIIKHRNKYNFIIISRVKTNFKNELIINDFFKIKDSLFNEADILINFAAIVHSTKNIKREVYKKINYDLPIFLFEKAKENKIEHFIQMSSIAVYKRNGHINILTEEKPTTDYGLFKLKTDNFLINNSENKISVSCIRPPMVYGYISPGNMIKLIKIAKTSIPLPFKNINSKLSFIHVDNLIEFIHITIVKQLFNVLIPTDKNETSVKEIIKIVRRNQNKTFKLFSMPKAIKWLFIFLAPNLYMKLFKNLTVECNVDDKIYKPKFDINDGVLKTLSKL
jgi:UDP-glucose 4-epimerase